MVSVSLPGWSVTFRCLIAPGNPSFAHAPCKELKIGPCTARLDDPILFIGFAGMLALASCKKVYLATPRRKRTRILAAHAEQNQLGNVAEIEPDPASVRAAILAHLVPDNVGLVGEPPSLHNGEAFRQQGVRAPEIQVRRWRNEFANRKRHNVVELHRAIARQAPVLGRNLPSFVCELP